LICAVRVSGIWEDMRKKSRLTELVKRPIESRARHVAAACRLKRVQFTNVSDTDFAWNQSRAMIDHII
jgi:hypothetical protein